MRDYLLISILMIVLISPYMVIHAQEITSSPGDEIKIISPSPGQALQGTVLVQAEINLEEPYSLELSFTYSGDQRDTWFNLLEREDDTPGEIQFEWDTTNITDGQYDLRVVLNVDQDQIILILPGLRVRNYTAIETSTPIATGTTAPVETQALTPSPEPITTSQPLTPTALPPNPAQINPADIGRSITTGSVIVIGLFVILGLNQFLRNRRRKDT